MLTTPPLRLIALALSLGVLSVLLASPGTLPASPALAQEPAADGHVIVQYRSEQVAASAQNLTADGPSLEDQGFRKVAIPEGKTAADVIAELESDPDVISAEEDAPVFAAATPNDPFYFGSQSHYMDTLNAPAAWDLHTGSNQVVVAVIDSGIDVNHPDLAGRLWVNPNDSDNDGVDDDNNGCIDDKHGCRFIDLTPARQAQCEYTSSARTGAIQDDNALSHGTRVAGVIGAAGNNGTGVSGVAWDVRIMTIKALDCGVNGAAPGGEMSNVAQGIDYARRMGADIINLSLASPPGSNGDISVLRAAIAAAEADGVILVASAGNFGSSGPGYPAAYTQYSNVIGVGASQTATGDTWATYSAYGAGVDIAAPGDGIASTIRSDLGSPVPYGVGTGNGGTSFSAPLVSGMFALMQSRNSRLTMADYIDLALDNASPAQPAPHGGNWAGAGIANIGGAVAALPMTLNGAPLHDWMDVPVDTPIRALIGGTECGTTTSTIFGPVSRYSIRVLSEAEKDGCGQIGRSVVLQIDGRPADPAIPWSIRDQDLGIINRDVSSVSPPPGSVVVQTLVSGWSLIAQLPPGGDLPNAVNYLPGSWTQLARWLPGNGASPGFLAHERDAPRFAQTLTGLARFDVFWVRGGPTNLALPNPDAPPRSVELHEGWNTFLYTGPHAKVSDALAGLDGSYTQVLRYDTAAGAWATHIAGAPRYLNGFGGLMELQIYWIEMTAPAVLEMP